MLLKRTHLAAVLAVLISPPALTAEPPVLAATVEAFATAIEKGECDSAPAIDTSGAKEPDLERAHSRIHKTLVQAPASCENALRTAFAELRLAGDRLFALKKQTAVSFGEAMRWNPDFDFLPGDVFVIRGGTMVSAAVSQIGERPAFFSHAAIIGTDPAWEEPEVVESVVGGGVESERLDEWMKTSFVRAAVFRHRDRAVAERASIAAYRDGGKRNGRELEYDFALSLQDSTQLYCTELVARAYAEADPKAPPVPLRLSNVGALVETFPLSALGMTERPVFLPDDLELDPRFDLVLEVRLPEALAQTDPMDRTFRRLFDRLRGPERDQVLVEMDARASHAQASLIRLFGGQGEAYNRLPEPVKLRVTGFAKLAVEELEKEKHAALHPP